MLPRDQWRNDSDELADATERFLEEARKQKEANAKENVQSQMRKIGQDLAENGFEKVREEVRLFEVAEKGRENEDVVTALNAVDAIGGGASALDKEAKVLEEMKRRADGISIRNALRPGIDDGHADNPAVHRQ